MNMALLSLGVTAILGLAIGICLRLRARSQRRKYESRSMRRVRGYVLRAPHHSAIRDDHHAPTVRR